LSLTVEPKGPDPRAIFFLDGGLELSQAVSKALPRARRLGTEPFLARRGSSGFLLALIGARLRAPVFATLTLAACERERDQREREEPKPGCGAESLQRG
jgi:hypothetical protein